MKYVVIIMLWDDVLFVYLKTCCKVLFLKCVLTREVVKKRGDEDREREE